MTIKQMVVESFSKEVGKDEVVVNDIYERLEKNIKGGNVVGALKRLLNIDKPMYKVMSEGYLLEWFMGGGYSDYDKFLETIDSMSIGETPEGLMAVAIVGSEQPKEDEDEDEDEEEGIDE